MFILSFLNEVHIGLITHKQFMPSVAGFDGRRVHFVAVSDDNTMKSTANHPRNRYGGAISQACVQHSFFVRVHHSCRYISPVRTAICTQ